MRADRFSLALFILYCLEVGVFLALIPWTSVWDRGLGHLPWSPLRDFVVHPAVRSAVTGFGLIHLLYGCHDLQLLLGRRPLE
jgi:hypothetical protein